MKTSQRLTPKPPISERARTSVSKLVLISISEITAENECWKVSQEKSIEDTIMKIQDVQSEIESNHFSIRETNHQIVMWEGLLEMETEKYENVKKVYVDRSKFKMEETTRKENLENEIIFLKNQFENMKCHRLDFMQAMILYYTR